METKVVLVVERSGLVATDMDECIREAYPNSRVLIAKTLEDGEKLARSQTRLDLAIVSSFAEYLPRSPLMAHIRSTSTPLAVSAPVNLDMAAFGKVHSLPTPFTSHALRQMLAKVSRSDADGGDRTVRP